MIRPIRMLHAAGCCALLLASAPALADTPQPVPNEMGVPVVAASGVQEEAIANMMDAGEKIIELAGAVPPAKWGWRPGKGVRSVGEVYLHVVQANYLMCSFLGVKPPLPAEELRKLETAPQSPASMVKHLQDSYAFASKTMRELPVSDLESTVEFFGHPMTKRAVLMNIAAHSHEHLGQSIAYARTNKVVPPWTAREQKASKQKASAAGHEGSGR